MPLWVNPMLRARQEAMEANFLIQSRDTVAVTIRKAKETAGIIVKSLPKFFIHLRGVKYTPF